MMAVLEGYAEYRCGTGSSVASGLFAAMPAGQSAKLKPFSHRARSFALRAVLFVLFTRLRPEILSGMLWAILTSRRRIVISSIIRNIALPCCDNASDVSSFQEKTK
jgi:hypothetical protein